MLMATAAGLSATDPLSAAQSYGNDCRSGVVIQKPDGTLRAVSSRGGPEAPGLNVPEQRALYEEPDLKG
jgi:hypothetical protein